MLNIYRQQNQDIDEPQKAEVHDAPKPGKVDFQKYVDPTGELDSKELGYGIWYVEHRVLIYRSILCILITTSLVLWGYSLIGWAGFFVDWQKDAVLQNQIATAPNYTALTKHFAPTQLQVLSTELLPGGQDKYDAVSEVANTDEHFAVQITYYFEVGGTKTPERTTILLPGDDRPVAELGLDGLTGAEPVVLQISHLEWRRLPAHQYAKPLDWQATHLDFTVASTSFSFDQNTPTSLKDNRITFQLTNNSPYGYVQPSFYVGLYDGDTLVGVMPLTLPQFASLQTVPVDLRNFVTGLNASDVKVFPLINIYDPSVYMTSP